jgi:hypothetical protein
VKLQMQTGHDLFANLYRLLQKVPNSSAPDCARTVPSELFSRLFEPNFLGQLGSRRMLTNTESEHRNAT